MIIMRLTSLSLIGFLTLPLLVSFTAPVVAYDCDYARNIEKTLVLEGASTLVVGAGAGSLQILGDQNRSDIQIEAVLCAEDKDDLDKMDVRSRVRNGEAEIETLIPRDTNWVGSNQKSIELTLRVPAGMKLIVDDTSGAAEVRRVASLVMRDSSGKLEIEQIEGDVNVTDSSGGIYIDDVQGDVTITDSSGGIKVRDVKGKLHVLVDSSGEIDAKRIGQDVIIDTDSSGSIKIKDVGGDFVVGKDGSGGIDYQDVAGKVDIPQRKRKN